MKNIVTARSDAMNVVGNLRISTADVSAVFVLHKLLEAIFAQNFILLVIGLVFF